MGGRAPAWHAQGLGFGLWHGKAESKLTSRLLKIALGGCQSGTLLLCNFLTWKKEAVSSFSKMAYCMLSVAEYCGTELLTGIFQPPFSGRWANCYPLWPLICRRVLCEWFLFFLKSISASSFRVRHFKVSCYCSAACSTDHRRSSLALWAPAVPVIREAEAGGWREQAARMT